jgi:hypothetical protein
MLLSLLLVTGAAQAGLSHLWGEQGELWDPLGRLPDFSYAGYAQGELNIPKVPVETNVTKFGAVGDGLTDDTAAFQAAIDATDRGAIFIPEGTFRIEGQLTINKSLILLRGAGPDKTILDFPNSLTDLFGSAPQWSWNGGLIEVKPTGSSTTLSSISGEAKRGYNSLLVDDTEHLVGHVMVVLHLTDDSEGTLGRHLYADQADGGDCSYLQPITLSIPLRIESVRENAVHFTQPFRVDIRSEWQPVLRSYPNIDNVGFESFRIRFPETEYAGHLNEPGYNGIFMKGGVVNSWVKDLVIENADNGILTDQLSKWITVDGLTFEGREGHHGLNIAHTADSLFTNLHYSSEWRHYLTVDHRSNGNVFKKITSDGFQISMDHHRDSPFENLFTRVDTDANLFNGGSACAGYPGGARNTFWGHAYPLIPPYWKHIQSNLVGPTTVEASLTEDREWIEPIEDLVPRDLHQAQLNRRMGWAPVDTAPPDSNETGTDTGSQRELPDKPRAGCSCGTRQAQPTRLPLWALIAWVGLRRIRQPKTE